MLTESLLIDSNQPYFFWKKTKTLSTGELGLADHVVVGYQADVAEKKYFGMLYEEKKRGIMDYWKALPVEEQEAIHAASKQGDWNKYEITCKGDRVKMELNGYVTCNIIDPEGAKEGVIALQLHRGDPMEVRFKDIYIKQLKAR